MLKIHTAYRYDFWKCGSVTERILLLAVTLGEADSVRHVYKIGVIKRSRLLNHVIANVGFCYLTQFS